MTIHSDGELYSSRDGFDVVCAGEALIQLHPEGPGGLEAADRCALAVGGAELNVAAGLAMRGHRVGWAGRVGADPFGRRVRAHLRRYGVADDFVDVGDGPTGVYFKEPSGIASSPYYYRSTSAATTLGPEAAHAWAAAGHARVVHLSGVLALISDSAARLCREIVEARAFGLETLISFDVNMRWALAGPDSPSLLLDLARSADIVFVGRDEAEALWGTPTADDIRRHIGGEAVLVVKDGDHEAVSFTPAGRVSVPAGKVDVVEVTGAGDAFAAGWLSGMLRGEEEADRLRRGHRAAAQALSAAGDLPEPHLIEME